jgi:hypothetical protein
MRKVLLGLLLLVVSPILAQTAYTSSAPATCNAASHIPPASFSFFSCHDFYDNNSIELYYTGAPRIELWTPNFMIGPYQSTLTVTKFTNPSDNTLKPNTPGIISFNWVGLDSEGVLHNGTYSGTWINTRDQLGWWSPRILQSTIIIVE